MFSALIFFRLKEHLSTSTMASKMVLIFCCLVAMSAIFETTEARAYQSCTIFADGDDNCQAGYYCYSGDNMCHRMGCGSNHAGVGDRCVPL